MRNTNFDFQHQDILVRANQLHLFNLYISLTFYAYKQYFKLKIVVIDVSKQFVIGFCLMKVIFVSKNGVLQSV